MSTPTFTAADFIKRTVEFCGGWGDEAASYLASEMASALSKLEAERDALKAENRDQRAVLNGVLLGLVKWHDGWSMNDSMKRYVMSLINSVTALLGEKDGGK
jgi:hypothetical protein